MSASPRFPPTPTCWKAPREASGIKKRSVVPKRKAGFFFPRHGVWGLEVGGEKLIRRKLRLRHKFRQFWKIFNGENVPESVQIGKIWRKDWHVCWWLNQPIWKISSSNLSNFPRFRGGNKKPIWKYHLVKDDFCGIFFHFDFLQIPQNKQRGWSAPAPSFVPPNPANIGVFQESKKRASC